MAAKRSSRSVDLSRTIGWFTSLFPVRLDPGAVDLDEALAGGRALGRAFKAIKEQLRQLPNHGLGYGLLRYLNPETASQLTGLAAPQVGFNYLGRFAAAEGTDWASAPEAATLGSGSDPAMPLPHAIEINAFTADDAAGPQFVATWSWASALLSETCVRDLARRWFQVLETLSRQAGQPGIGGRTPSDVPLVALSQAELERLESKYPDLEEVLPLTPLQEGLLFHALYDAGAADVYTVQLALEFAGELEEEVLKASVRALLQRHSSLRAGFEHEELGRPVQIVRPGADPVWREIDLTSLSAANRERRIAELLNEDRAQRFDVARAPLWRCMLIRLAAQQHRVVLSSHHLLTDGWSVPILVQELFTSMRTMPMSRRCRGLRPIGIIWAGLRHRTTPRRLRPGRTPWPGWRKPAAWRRTTGAVRRWRRSRLRWR